MHKKLQALFIGVLATSFVLCLWSTRQPIATDKTEITLVSVHSIRKPHSVEALRSLVTEADKPLSVGGSFYSQGGQTAYPGGIVVDMSRLNKIIDLNVKNKVTTQLPPHSASSFKKI